MIKNSMIFGSLALLLVLGGCGGSNSSTSVGGTGTLAVSITDVPSCGFDQVNITISKISVHQSSDAEEDESGWRDIILSPPRKINLSSLVNGVLEDLGQTSLPAGHYTQLRLVLLPNSASEPLNNSVLPTGGAETAVDTPSAVQSGIKLVHSFHVASDSLVDLVLDFDACRSIVKKGNGKYSLKPVIRVIPMEVSGRIVGYILPGLSSNNPVVYAEQGGAVVKSTIPDSTGYFILSPLQQSSTAGTYDIVITADDHVTAMVTSVPVTAKGITTISRSTQPISLNSSTMHAVSGAVIPVSAEALIRALQTSSAGPVMEVRSISTDLSDGSYSLALPADAPLLGSYEGSLLPVTFIPDTSIAGKYDLEASADGYESKTEPADISIMDQTINLILTESP